MNQELLEQLIQITPEEEEILNGRGTIDKSRYMDTQSMVIDSKRLLNIGKLIHVRPHTRFIHFPKHTHNFVEVIYMCSGQTHHIINDKEVILYAGELLFLSQSATQEILPCNEEDVAVNFIILPEFFNQSIAMMGQEDNSFRNFIIGCLKSNNDVGYLHFKATDILPVQNLVENLIWTIINDKPNNRNMAQITMGLLFLELMNYSEKVEVGKEYLEQKLLLVILRYIEENYKDGQLSILAGKLGYDLYYLSRMIKKVTGSTYKELLQTKRFHQAVFLLEQTRLSISDIAYSVGYSNISYFHKVFYKKYEMTPNQYRKKYNEKS